MLLGNKSHTVGKPVYFPFKVCHICNKNAFVGWAAELSIWVALQEEFDKSLLMPNSLFCCCYWLLFQASGTPRCWQSGAWLAPDCQHLWAQCSKNRHATFDWAGQGPCNEATSLWCSVNPCCGIICVGNVWDRPQSGCPQKTTPWEDHLLTLSALRQSTIDFQSRFAGHYGWWLPAQAIRNRLHAVNLRSHRAARRPSMTAVHHQVRLGWWSRFCLP